jgi:hypothetical protein
MTQENESLPPEPMPEPLPEPLPETPVEAAPEPPPLPAVLTPNAPAPDVPIPDTAKHQQLTDQIVPLLVAELGDVVRAGQAALTEAANYYAPLIATQALLETSADPQIRARAVGHRRHLQGQMLMGAGARAIGLQQSQEQTALKVLNVALAFGMKFLTGGIV